VEKKEMFANNNSTKEPKKGAGSKAVEKLEDRQVYCTTGKKSGGENLETMTIKPLEMSSHPSQGEKGMLSR